MNLNHKTNYSNGDTLDAQAWNKLAEDVNELGAGGIGNNSEVVTATQDTEATDPTVNIAVASGVNEVGSPNIIQLTKKSKGVNTTVVSGNNINFEPREANGTGGEKNNNSGNMKGGNISFKPGDDIELCSHHRGTSKNTEVAVKVMDGEENPVKLQLFAADITLSTKDKNKTKVKDANGEDTSTALYDDPNVMNINVTTGSGKGYLKVRAQAIDLRCEDHGGIAIQPKGTDGQDHMNKIKFEHGGGDGLEFGTFNTEKTSIYTKEYRFNKDGKILLATRTPVARATDGTDSKYDANDATTHYTYTKQADDFYDVIYEGESGSEFYSYDPTDVADTSVTWGDLVKLVAYMKTNSQGPWA